VQFSNHASNPTELTCQWFAGKKLESGKFPPASLKPATPETK
jgi:hypothetical protein